jgi:hypothetical protein
MLDLIPLNDESACALCHFYKKSPYRISDYSIGIKRMWKDLLHPTYTVTNGCLAVMCTVMGRNVFDYPMPIAEDADVDGALEQMAAHCRESFLPFELQNVPKEEVSRIVSLFPHCEVTYRRSESDYLYETAALSAMEGRGYAGQRNHIKRFRQAYPGAEFRVFGSQDVEAIKRFLRRFSSGFVKGARGSKSELERAEKMIARVGSPCFACGGFVMDGEILSFCLSEVCGDMLIDHIEKALPEFEGIYPATVQAFLQKFGGTARYFNREDDAADRGLRISKLQYRPCEIVHKYAVKVHNELRRLERPPELVSERLTYGAILPEEIDSYNRLCLDEERNRYWGYDYRIHCENPERDYFYLDQKKDFTYRILLALAIRHEGRFIGEVLLHNFDGKGQAEIGIRILPEYGGNGYGREALHTILHYGLYTLGLDAIRAKCHKENVPSFNMLSAVMRKDGEDEVYYRFLATF